jgi:CRP-like cAMP-binding protein
VLAWPRSTPCSAVVPPTQPSSLMRCPFPSSLPSAGLAKEHRQEFIDALSPETFARDAYIVREGEPGDRFYIITQGEVVVTKGSGDAEITITHLYEVSRPLCPH